MKMRQLGLTTIILSAAMSFAQPSLASCRGGSAPTRMACDVVEALPGATRQAESAVARQAARALDEQRAREAATALQTSMRSSNDMAQAARVASDRKAQLAGAGGVYGKAAQPLSDAQRANINNWRVAKNARNVTYHRLPNDAVRVEKFSPAQNHGYGKVYYKDIDVGGKTTPYSFEKKNRSIYGQ